MYLHSKSIAAPVILIVLGIAGVVSAIICFSSGSGEAGAFLFLFGIIFIPLGISILKGNEFHKTLDFAKMDEKDSSMLILSGRNPILRKQILIKADYDYNVKYIPEELHYASATVGGVTTGGFYKTGGEHQVTSAGKNGFCRLEYGKYFISTIQLTDELYKLAKASPISGYLNSKKQIVVKDHVNLSDVETKRMIDQYEKTGYIGNEFAKKGMPTYEKCKAIRDWICGKDA